MKQKLLKALLTITILGIFSILIFGIFNTNLTANTIKNYASEKMFTKAICDSQECRDYEITCKNSEIVKITPTAFAIKNSNNYENISYSELESFC